MAVTATPNGQASKHWNVFYVREALCPRCGGELRQLRQARWSSGPGLLRCQNSLGDGKCNAPIFIDIFGTGVLCLVVGIPTAELYHRFKEQMEKGCLDAARALDELGVVASAMRGR